jgi:hypothetical protein
MIINTKIKSKSLRKNECTISKNLIGTHVRTRKDMYGTGKRKQVSSMLFPDTIFD